MKRRGGEGDTQKQRRQQKDHVNKQFSPHLKDAHTVSGTDGMSTESSKQDNKATNVTSKYREQRVDVT